MGKPFIAAGSSSESETNIHDLIDQIRDIQSRLGRLATAALPTEPTGEGEAPAASTGVIRSVLNLRAARRRIFGETLFGEPAWEILLELYEAQLAGRSESVSSICYASGVPGTTALRWIRHLENDEWIERAADPSDGRRYFLLLTKKGSEAMDRLFATNKLGDSRQTSAH